jgi:hypothetical protein
LDGCRFDGQSDLRISNAKQSRRLRGIGDEEERLVGYGWLLLALLEGKRSLKLGSNDWIDGRVEGCICSG